MKLVIYGRENLTTLTDWAVYYFSNITDRNLTPKTYNTTSFPPPYNSRIVFYYPVADSDIVTIYWQLPSMEKKYRNAVADFITRYIGQEDEGSILNYLKRNDLATSLSAGTEFDTDSYTLIFVQVELTDSGLNQISRVIHAVNKYVGLLRNISSEEEFKEHFEDFVGVQQTVFDYGERMVVKDYVQCVWL